MVRPEIVKKALDEIRKRSANYEYFFNHLKSPDWIEPLFNEGLFQHPPEPLREGEYISFPFWPESRYLVRMASISPKLVLTTILKIPTTANIRVHEDLADAASEACMKEPQLAAYWTNKESDWVASQQYLYLSLPEKLANLACKLAKAGELSQVLKLIKTLLVILPGTPIEDKDLKEESIKIPPEPKVRFDLYRYEQIVRKYIPQLLDVIGKEVLWMLLDLLEAAVSLSIHFPNKSLPEDYSYIWRPAVEDDKRNLGHNLKDVLVSGARDCAEYLAMKNPEIIPELVRNLEDRPWKIFKRIALHLLRRFPENARDLLADRLTARILFDDAEVSIRHEYSLLMGKCFASLTKDQQGIILKWIEAGPDIAKFKVSREQFWGRPVTDSDALRYKKHWQLERFAWIREDLPETWRRQYQSLITEFGEPEHPEFAIRTGATWVGPTSPKTVDALRLLTIDQLVSFLASWHPSGEPENPSPEGLGRELTALIVSEPERYATEANRFKGLDPTYVCALVYGFRDAVRQKLVLAWQPVLDLCLWVVNQPREIPGRKGEYADLDPGWVWTRKAIADLLSSGFEANATEIPFDLRPLVWQVLHPITSDPDPTPKHEAKYGGSNMDPATLSINTTRGEAMHAVIHYALWVNRHIVANATEAKRSIGSFDQIPEVREVLEYHLKPNQDASLAIRSVYGRWFPSLVFLNKTWAIQNKPVIFPSDEEFRDLRNAAWESYVVFCPAYDDVFDVLLEQYHYSIEKLGTASKDKRYPADPVERLAEHLITYYWRGKLSLEEGSLLARFYARAQDSLRSHAILFVGYTLKDEQGIVPSEILERLNFLWEKRLSIALLSPHLYTEELAAFGSWFASAKFDDNWSLEQLKIVLNLVNRAEPDHLVIERLARLSPNFPRLTVECLRLMIDGDKRGWGIYGWTEEARTIITEALGSEDEEAASAAINLIHILGSRGFFDFRDLLPTKEVPL